MKKLLSILLALSLIFGALLLTACEITVLPDDEEGEYEYLDIDEDTAKTKMDELAAGDGYEITYRANDEEETQTLGHKNGIFWMLSGDSGSAYQVDGDRFNSFSYSESDGWTYESSCSGEIGQSMIESLSYLSEYWFYFGHTYDGSLEKCGEGTVAGRQVIKYSFSYGAFGVSQSYDVSIDKELGITLALHIKAGYAGESAQFDYEVTEFHTGSAINLPDLPAVVSILEKCGLTEDDVKAGIGTGISNTMQVADELLLYVTFESTDFDTFESWANALADKCRGVATDGTIYEDEYLETACTSFDFDAQLPMNQAEFYYATEDYTAHVTVFSTGGDENTLACTLEAIED